MSNNFLTLNGTISGSLSLSDGLELGDNPINIGQVSILPSGNIGDLVVSGSNLYFYNGSDWMEMYGTSISTPTPTPTPTITPTPTVTNTPTPTATPTNDPIVFTIDIDPGGGNIFAVVGSSQNMNVEISSIIPSSGVTIDVVVQKDADNTTVFTSSISSSNVNNSVTITNLLPGVLCTTTVTVTSNNGGGNSSIKSFKIAAK